MRNELFLAIAITLLTQRASADDPAALAQSLFEEGRKLANEQNKWVEACPKFAESHRIKPGGGVVLNLALCYRKTGKTASSYARYKEGLAFAVRDKNDARIKIANDAIAELEPQLSYLTIVVTNDLPELKIELDGLSIPRAAWGSRFPVDPGKRAVVASAPGKKPRRLEVTVEDTADQKSIEIPALADAPQELPPPPPRPEVVRIDHPTRRWVGFAIGAVGAVGLGLGTYFGVRALDAKSKSDDACQGGCTTEGSSLSRDSVRFGDISTVAFAAGAVAIGAGTYLVLTSTTVRVAVAPDHAFLSLTARF